MDAIVIEDNWAYTGHLLAQNISYATVQQTNYLFVIGDSERKRAYKVLMCKASTTVGSKRKTEDVAPAKYPATYKGSL